MGGLGNIIVGKMYEKQLDQQTQGDDLTKLAKQLAYMQKVAEDVESGSGWKAKPYGAVQKLMQVIGVNPELDEYEALRGGLGSQYARKVYGEKGTLTEGDIKRAIGMFPSAWDSTEAKQRKFSAVRQLLESASGRDLSEIFNAR